MPLLTDVKHLIAKEIKLEMRQKYAINGIVLYLVATVFVGYLCFKTIVDAGTWDALFWIIMLFASINAVSKSFMMEKQGRLLYYYLLASPQAIILSKIIYNMLLMIVLSLICFAFYALFLGNMVQNIGLFLVVILVGNSGFAAILSMTSAIASKTNNSFTLMAILSFPLLMPLLLALMKISKNAIDGLALSVSYDYLLVLVLINVIIIILSYLLFPYLWRD
ncbi:MAG TPA: heme exporter protein CcmB [Bacteroidia bacterium]|nr:heme exporter protein CcmB [Bacteroidia bacterium]